MSLFGNGSKKFIWMACSACVVGMCLFPVIAQAKIFKWLDDQGKTHFTDNRSKIPLKYRGNATSTEGIKSKRGNEKPESSSTRADLGGGYSVELLKDWITQDASGMDYKVIATSPTDNFTPNCNLREEEHRGSVRDYTGKSLAVFDKKAKEDKWIIKNRSQRSFRASNANGMKVSQDIDSTVPKLKHLIYIFENSKKQKVTVTCMSTLTSKLESNFDKMVHSLQVN